MARTNQGVTLWGRVLDIKDVVERREVAIRAWSWLASAARNVEEVYDALRRANLVATMQPGGTKAVFRKAA